MGSRRDREKGPPEQTARWEFITLPDFKSGSPWTALAYAWLWLMALVSLIVYALDTFTAINLLIFDHWSSEIQPYIAFKYSKWIFAICILLSWTLLIYEWVRAIRVLRRGGVAESYMDPLARSAQCMRGKGWRRFLVFTELTKSKKGTDYVAFFVYFAFQGAIRVVICEGPRQVVNALTLYAVMEAKLIDHGATTDGNSHFVQFFLNIKTLADQNYEQAAILSSMLFTLVIWVFSALSLIGAAVLYLVFLWHYIPQRDGRLSIYCRRKIDRRLEKIVEHKVTAAIEDENKKREKAEKRAELKRQKTGELPSPQAPALTRQPTLPQLVAETSEPVQDEKKPLPPTRQDTSTSVSTLPPYSSRPPTRQGVQRQPTLPDLTERPDMPGRSDTNASEWSHASYESDAPLMSNAGYAGGEPRGYSPATTYMTRQESNASFARPIPARTITRSTQGTQRTQASMRRMQSPGPQQRSFTPVSRNDSYQSRAPPPGQRFPVRSNTGFSFETEPQSAISPISPENAYGRPAFPPITRRPIQSSVQHNRTNSQTSYFSRPTAPGVPPSAASGMLERQPTYGSLHSHTSSFSRPGPVPRINTTAQSTFRPYTPQLASAPPPPPPPKSQQQGQGNMPAPPPNSYEMTQQRSHTPFGPPSAPIPAPSTGNGGYVPFNPSRGHIPTPQRNFTMPNQPAPSGDWLQPQQSLQRSFTDFGGSSSRATSGVSGIGNIIDHYGGTSEDEGESRRF